MKKKVHLQMSSYWAQPTELPLRNKDTDFIPTDANVYILR